MSEIVYRDTVQGLFVRRLNRFVAEVDVSGAVRRVHVKNTGRLGELLLPGAAVTLQTARDPSRSTGFDLISVYKPGLDWVNIDSLAPNGLIRQLYLKAGYDLVRPEFACGRSRFDFYMERDGSKYLTEVKGCTLASSPRGPGLFPDAPTERGVRHLTELAEAAENGCHCAIVFVIQMNGISHVVPNDAAQPDFRRALVRAARAGVRVVCHACHIEADRIRLLDASDDTAYFV